jgi:hypothetical protein
LLINKSKLLNLQASIIDIAVEAWRFRRVFSNAISKLDATESSRYFNQYLYFFKKVESAIENANLKIINVEGKKYDIGLPVSPLNMEEFSQDDILVIDQMIEPIIMDSGKVLKSGTVILRRLEE